MRAWASPLGRLIVVRPTTVTVLDHETTPRLRDTIDKCLATHPAADALVIDMVNVTSCDTEGVAAIADAVRSMRERGGKTILMKVQDGPYAMLDAAIEQDATAVVTRTSDPEGLQMDRLEPIEP